MMGSSSPTLSLELKSRLLLGRRPASSLWNGGGWSNGIGYHVLSKSISVDHLEAGGGGSPNHLRFGEVAAGHNMNYVADATFAHIRVGGQPETHPPLALTMTEPVLNGYEDFFTHPLGPAGVGRYYRESGAAYRSPALPAGSCPLRVTWTEIPAAIWFDALTNGLGTPGQDGWMDTLENDRCGGGASGDIANGRRDVRIDLEVWDDLGTPSTADDMPRGVFEDPAGYNLPSSPIGRLYYKAVFVNEWDMATRMNTALDVTPFLDDVTITCLPPGGFRCLAWEPEA
jgi:hypothetical protein